MNQSEDGAAQARHWLELLQRVAGPAVTAAPLRIPFAPAMAALAAEALTHGRSLLLVTADDLPLADISNAFDLDLRPLCLILPAADYASRIALRATLSLLRSRLTRAGDDAEGPAWAAQRRQITAHSRLWNDCLGWCERGGSAEHWPAGMPILFPVRVLPLALARQMKVDSDWVVIANARHLPDDVCRPWPGALRTLLLEEAEPSVTVGLPVAADPLVQRRAEIEILTQELSDLELELATAQAEIADFTRRYHASIGTRIAALDALQARLAEHRAAASPDDPEAASAADDARRRAEQSHREDRRFAETGRPAEKPFAPSRDIRKLYRRLAQRIHPDRARDEAERAWRTQLMAEANRAYQAGDEATLLEIFALWSEGTQDDVGRQDAAPGIDALDAQMTRLRRRIGEIEDELNRLFGSRLYELFTAANIARRVGRDLLQEMADKLDADIAAARAELGDASL